MSKQKPVSKRMLAEVLRLNRAGVLPGLIAKTLKTSASHINCIIQRETGHVSPRAYECAPMASYKPLKKSESEIDAMYARQGRNYAGRRT